MASSRPMLLVGVLLLHHAVAAAAAALTTHCPPPLPYGPHDAPAGKPFFQGWYTRVTIPGEPNTSLAVVIGAHLPAANTKSVRTAEHDVVCMLLLSQPEQGQRLRVFTHYFTGLDVITQPDDSGRDCGSEPQLRAFELHTRNNNDVSMHATPQRSPLQTPQLASCVMRVNMDRIDIRLNFPGEATVHVRSDAPGGSVIALPWSPDRISPEAWEAFVPGGWVGLHYATLSLATPVSVSMQLLPHSEPLLPHEPTTRPAKGLHERASHHEGPEAMPFNDVAGEAHLEAQYGRAFPQRWLWSQGHHSQEHDNSTQAFVLVGGDLPLAQPLPPFHSFMFSFRDTAAGVNVAIDPTDPALPGWGIQESAHACEGRLSLQLYSLTHIVQVDIEAAPESFAAVACPTEAGFVPLSVESYAAIARIKLLRKRLFREPELLAQAVFEGAAVEFGGAYRCSGDGRVQAMAY